MDNEHIFGPENLHTDANCLLIHTYCPTCSQESPLCWVSEVISRPETTIDLHPDDADSLLVQTYCPQHLPKAARRNIPALRTS